MGKLEFKPGELVKLDSQLFGQTISNKDPSWGSLKDYKFLEGKIVLYLEIAEYQLLDKMVWHKILFDNKIYGIFDNTKDKTNIHKVEI